MIKLWKANGGINRRQFLRGCGQAMVVTASYEAVSVILGERVALAGPADVHRPDEPLDASLETPRTVQYEAGERSVSKSRVDSMNVIDSIKAKVKHKFEIRTPTAICGVRG